ncbi:MAG: hypothetical protein ACK4WD_07485 [Flavobacteriales bacterium]|jgi:hypothetical protein
MKAFSLFLTFIVITPALLAQYYELPEEEETPLLSVSELNVSFGNWSINPSTEGINDFQKLAPRSELLKMNIDGYEFQPFGFFISNTSLNLNVGFNIRSNWKEKYGQRLRIGLSSAQAELLAGSYSRSDSFPYDTLVSSSTGAVQILDSINYQYLTLSHSSRSLLLDASYLIVLNPNKRWSFYTGLGLGLGWTVNAETNIQYSSRWTTEEDDYFRPVAGASGEFDEQKTEYFRNKKSFVMTTSLPLGIDFRIGKKRQFWMPIHLFYEMQPTLRLNNIPEIGMISHLPVVQNFGLRVTI